MSEMSFSVETSIEVERGVEDVYAWMSDFPASLSVFPLMKNVREVEKDRRYAFQIGPFGYKEYRADAHFDASLEKEENRGLRIVSIPGSGNTELSAQVLLESAGRARTKVSFIMNASSDQKIPRLVPRRLASSIAEKAASAALKQGLKNAKRAVEQAYPAA